MELEVAESPANSDSVDNGNKNAFDFKRQLMIAVEKQQAKTSSDSLEKKKNKRKKGKGSKKCASASSRNYRSLDMLNECVLEDQMLADEKSEIIKSNRKMKIN